IAEAREGHYEKFPTLKEFQAILDTPGGSSSPDAFVRLLEVLPYARYNIIQYARSQGLAVHELFAPELEKGRISVLNKEQRPRNELSTDSCAGECSARKKSAHGLFSRSQIYLWVANELHPFSQVYTVGHELIHYQQIKAMMDREQRALEKG